jgi:hypothetical protein
MISDGFSLLFPNFSDVFLILFGIVSVNIPIKKLKSIQRKKSNPLLKNERKILCPRSSITLIEEQISDIQSSLIPGKPG